MRQLNSESLQTAYGKPPAALETRVLQTLDAFSGENEDCKQRSRQWIVVAALALGILALSTALAITLRSEFTRRLGLPEAAETMVQAPDPGSSSAVTDMAVFTVDSYLFDGISFMADVRIDPNRSGIWILPDMYERFLDYPASNIGAEMTDQSIRDYAASMGIQQIRYVQVTGSASDESASVLWIKSEPYLGNDGHIHLLLTTSMLDSTKQELDLTIRFYVLFGAQPREDTVTLHMIADAEPETQHLPLEREVLGVTIQRVEIIRTPAVSYYRMTYTCSPDVGHRVAAVPLYWDSEDDLVITHLWQGAHYSDESRTGIFLGPLPPSAETCGQFTFRLLVNGQRSEPVVFSLPAISHELANDS